MPLLWIFQVVSDVRMMMADWLHKHSYFTSASHRSEETTTKFRTRPFAEGRFRFAYKGVYTAPSSKQGQECVIKKQKDTFTWKATDWQDTLLIVKISKKLASGFNTYSKTSRPVKFTDVETTQAVEVVRRSKIKLDEYVTVEDYIPGKYTKFCNNYGFIDPHSTSMPAFVHWSWAHTKGETMIADLQGVKQDNAYYLTDPCLLSATHGGKYGSTDTGIEGMAMFFLNHTCTDFCKTLPKPDESVMSEFRSLKLEQQTHIVGATAYTHEISSSKEVQAALIKKFKKSACTARL